MHLFTLVTRRKFELAATDRFYDICNAIAEDPDGKNASLFLGDFEESCEDYTPRYVQLTCGMIT